jgi:hypothetical protein
LAGEERARGGDDDASRRAFAMESEVKLANVGGRGSLVHDVVVDKAHI